MQDVKNTANYQREYTAIPPLGPALATVLFLSLVGSWSLSFPSKWVWLPSTARWIQIQNEPRMNENDESRSNHQPHWLIIFTKLSACKLTTWANRCRLWSNLCACARVCVSVCVHVYACVLLSLRLSTSCYSGGVSSFIGWPICRSVQCFRW